MAIVNITTAPGRARLKARGEPYFLKIRKGQYIGFRKTIGSGAWLARFTRGKAKEYLTLGDATRDYDDVLPEALAWFSRMSGEESADQNLTVKRAIAIYVKDLESRRGKVAADRAIASVQKHIMRNAIADTRIAKLTARQLRAWLNDAVVGIDDPEQLRRSKDTINRVFSNVKAALNHAFREGLVASDIAWRRVKPFPNTTRARDVFLTAQQCQRLVDACAPDFAAIAISGLLTGARYGELLRRTVADLDLRQGVLHIPDGKTGSRDAVLTSTAIAHFRKLAKDKLPGALLHQRANGATWKHAEQARALKRAVAAANAKISNPADRIPAATCFYTLRHTHASLALLAGVNAQVLAENLGTSILMLEKHYGKFLRADRRAMLERIGLSL